MACAFLEDNSKLEWSVTRQVSAQFLGAALDDLSEAGWTIHQIDLLAIAQSHSHPDYYTVIACRRKK